MSDDIEYQCWICPTCNDDHLQSKGCEKYVSELKQHIKKLERALEAIANKCENALVTDNDYANKLIEHIGKQARARVDES